MDIIMPQVGLVFWTLAIFLVFFFLMRKFAWGLILKGLKDREETIEKSLMDAQNARDEMAKLTADNEKIMREAQEDRSKILKEAREMKDKIVAEAREEASEESGRMIEKAREEIQAEKMAAIIEIKNQVGQLSISIAEKLIHSELKSKDGQEKVIEKLVSEIKLN